jgi:aryl-alcohol dehydrogenase-like predicted oxidoreductase
MKSRPLGALPVSVSEIGLGTAQLANVDGQVRGVKLVPAEVARTILRAAIDRGVTFFDTGDEYGAAEALLGELPSQVKRTVFIATKAGRKPDGAREFSPRYLEERVDRSLRRLGVGRLDLFQLNKPSAATLQDADLMAFLSRLKAQGKIRYAGVVVAHVEAGLAAIRSGVVDCLQVLYNLLYLETEAVMDAAHRAGVGVIVRSPLNSGVLSGAYTPETSFPAQDERSQYFTGRAFTERLEALRRIQADLHVSDRTLLEFALTFILSNPAVSIAIPGASRVEQVERYTGCSGLELFSEAERQRIREVVTREMLGLDHAFQSS